MPLVPRRASPSGADEVIRLRRIEQDDWAYAQSRQIG
jgi:hypothetical protein